MKLPMREKYVDERVGVWMVLGEHDDGSVDVESQYGCVFTSLPPDVADEVVAAHDTFRKSLYELLTK